MNLVKAVFGEIKSKCSNITDKILQPYTIVNLGGQVVYVEGQKGILKLSTEVVSCKLKTGHFEVKGEDLSIKEITQTTIIIQGKKIYKIEVF